MTQIITNSNWGWGKWWSTYTAWTWIEISEQNEISVETDVLNWAAAWATALQSWDNISELNNDANYITSSALSDYQTVDNLVTDLTNPDDTHYPSAKAVSDAISSWGSGDMLKSVYDPNSVEANAFDYDNFINTPDIPTDTSDLTNWAWYITGIDSWDVTTALWYTPYNATNPNGYVTSSIISDTAYGSWWDWDTTHAPTKNAVYDKIDSIDELIPSAATSSNQLTDKNYVDDSINSVTAYYITKNAQWDQFATKAELTAATTFYSGWVVRVPTRNDYTIVLADEDHDNATTRYIYNSGWEYQYTVNETALTTAQLNALNSWITAAKVTTYDWYASWKQDTLSTQTVYTSKWTASKVPQITTNALGQVTWITEVNISYPSQVSDTAYWSSWDWVTATAPSQNAVYDKISAMDTTIGWKQSQHSSISVTLSSSGWSSSTQTVTATWVTASNTVIVSPAPSSLTDYADAGIYCSAQASNSLTFSCDTEPENDIVVNVLIMN